MGTAANALITKANVIPREKFDAEAEGMESRHRHAREKPLKARESKKRVDVRTGTVPKIPSPLTHRTQPSLERTRRPVSISRSLRPCTPAAADGRRLWCRSQTTCHSDSI